jgi:hypothetical protein
MMEARVELYDAAEIQGFAQFMSDIQKYRDNKWKNRSNADNDGTTGNTGEQTQTVESISGEKQAAVKEAEAIINGTAARPEEDAAVVGHIPTAITYEDVDRAFREYYTGKIDQAGNTIVQGVGLDGARTLLKEFGVQKLPDLKPEQYSAFLNAMALVTA